MPLVVAEMIFDGVCQLHSLVLVYKLAWYRILMKYTPSLLACVNVV